MPGWHSLLPVQWSIIGYSDEAFLPLNLRPLGQQSIRSLEQEAKILLVGLGVLVSGATAILPLES